ncbi:MAG: glutaredoxin family protein [Myxococcales bacterium]|nr:glutaredoxin family protein [Myxococcales bacterium]
MARKLILYHFEGCYYCDRVQGKLAELGLLIEQRNIRRDPEHRAELIANTGRARVPVLRIEEAGEPVRWMPESRRIVAFLEQAYGDSEAPETPVCSSTVPRIGAWLGWSLMVVGLLVSGDGLRDGLWAAGCGVMALRSGWMARSSGMALHWIIALALGLSALSIALAGLGVAFIPFWYLVYGLVAALLLWAARRARR